MTDLPPGPELDALVAEKVMGWRLHGTGRGGTYPAYYIDSKRGVVRSLPDEPENDAFDITQPWSPSSDIRAAKEVVENLREDGWNVAMDDSGTLWWCEFALWEETNRLRGLKCLAEEAASAETLPHAISLAALKAVAVRP